MKQIKFIDVEHSNTVLSTFAITTSAVQAADVPDPLRLGIDVPYAPFGYKLPSGELTGFEIELGNAICAKINRDCEWVIQAWDGIIPGLMARKYDAIMSSMAITEERRQLCQPNVCVQGAEPIAVVTEDLRGCDL